METDREERMEKLLREIKLGRLEMNEQLQKMTDEVAEIRGILVSMFILILCVFIVASLIWLYFFVVSG